MVRKTFWEPVTPKIRVSGSRFPESPMEIAHCSPEQLRQGKVMPTYVEKSVIVTTRTKP